MRRWFLLCFAVLFATPLFAQTDDLPPLTGATYNNGVYARYPEGWVAYRDDANTLYLSTSYDIYDDDMFPDAGEAFMAIGLRSFEDTPRIPPNENTVTAASRLVPGTASRGAYTAIRSDIQRYRVGQLDAPFMPNTRQYILFFGQSRYADILVGTAPGEFDRFAPIFERMINTLVFVDRAPPDAQTPFYGTSYFPNGYFLSGSEFNFNESALVMSLRHEWDLIEISRNRFFITTQQNPGTPYLFPGEFIIEATFAEIPEDAVATPVSLLYESLPREEQRVLVVDKFTLFGTEYARAVLSDSDFLLTRLLLEPEQPPAEGEEPQPPQLRYYLTLRITVEPNSLEQLEASFFEMLNSAYVVNEPYYPYAVRTYPDFDAEALAPSTYISARADLETAYPADWYVVEKPDSLILSSSGDPIQVDNPDLERRPEQTMMRLSVRSDGQNAFGFYDALYEIPYQMQDVDADDVTIINTGNIEVVRFIDFNTRHTVYLLPDGRDRFFQATVYSESETPELTERQVLAVLAQTRLRSLGSGGGGGIPALTEIFSARSQNVEFDIPRNWYIGELTDGAVSSAIIGIPLHSGTPLRGDVASPEFQRNAAALLTITYDEPPTFSFLNDEGEFERRALPLYNYLVDVIGTNDILPEQLTIAGYSALRRLENGSGHILIQRSDGSVVRVYVQNLTGDSTNYDYSFGYEDAMYAVLETLRYPPADATEPTETYISGAKNYRIQYPYDWQITQQETEFTVNETPFTERVTYFSNVRDFDPTNISSGQVRISVQVEPQNIQRDYDFRSRPNFRVSIGDAINGETAEGAIYNSAAIFTAETPTREIVIMMETTSQDLERFYPTLVKMVTSLQVTAGSS